MDIAKIKDECVEWIRNYFKENGDGCNAVIGISGGKDSTIVAALCVEALGKERVIGILMPCRKQSDIGDAYRVVEHLGIQSYEVDVFPAMQEVLRGVRAHVKPTVQTRVNLTPRIRMATLYAFSQSLNGRVANTCNLSENTIGFSTVYGDGAGDFAPIAMLTVTELFELGKYLKLPIDLVEKRPACDHGDDEEVIGFSYAVLDKYIRCGICEDERVKAEIDKLERQNRFKLEKMPVFNPTL